MNAALRGFQRMFPEESFTVEGVAVPSGVSDQPHTDTETCKGAWNRADRASQERPDADFFVGLEGGIEAQGADMASFAWVVVKSNSGLFGKAKTATFFLAPPVAALIRQGKELGEADDIVFGQTNSKQANGAVGLLTDNAVDRAAYYSDAVLFALIPFKKRELYFPSAS